MERWTYRLLPYFSIMLNILLCWAFWEPRFGEVVVYSDKYATVIQLLLDFPLL